MLELWLNQEEHNSPQAASGTKEAGHEVEIEMQFIKFILCIKSYLRNKFVYCFLNDVERLHLL